MRKLFYILPLLIMGLTSCLKSDLDELPVYTEAEMTDFDLEYRYVVKNDNGVEKLAVVTLATTPVIDNNTMTITLSPAIPAPTSSFTQSERRKVSLQSIVGYAKISPAAKVVPLDGAPKLGVPADFSTARKYKVVAADGKTSKEWTIKVNPLPIINQYEGTYTSTGHFDHPSSPRDLNLVKYLTSVDASTVTCPHSDLGDSGYTLTIKINSDNTLDVKQFANGNPIGEMTPGLENSYNPTTKVFTLHYRYLGGNGWRTINETLTLK